MTSTRTVEFPDTASGVLDELRVEQDTLAAAEVRKLRLVVAWAAMHSADSIVGAVDGVVGAGAADGRTRLAGGRGVLRPGARDHPRVSPTTPPVATCGTRSSWPTGSRRSTTASSVGSAGVAGPSDRPADLLPPPGRSGFVDTHLAPVAAKAGPAAIVRLVEEARVRFDPEEAELRRLDAAEHRCLDIDLQNTGYDGTVAITGNLDYADARDLEAAVSAGAEELAGLGVKESVHVRRSMALGVMARNQLTLDLNTGAPEGGKRVKARQVVIHVHLAEPPRQPGRPGRGDRPPRRTGVGRAGRGVVHPPRHPGHHPTRHRPQGQPAAPRRTRSPTGSATTSSSATPPACSPSARGTRDAATSTTSSPGTTAEKPPQPTSPRSAARHHRLKTTGGWTYQRQPDGTYTWTTRHGRQA